MLLRLEDQPAGSDSVNTAKTVLRSRFGACELPDDFVAHLRADPKALADANRLNQAETGSGVEDTGLIGQLPGKINYEIGELDAIMHNKYRRQPEKPRAWQRASHFERALQQEKNPTPPAPPAAPGK